MRIVVTLALPVLLILSLLGFDFFYELNGRANPPVACAPGQPCHVAP